MPGPRVAVGFIGDKRGCKPEPPKIPTENVAHDVSGLFGYPTRFPCMFWRLKQTVFGLAMSLPENNCFPASQAALTSLSKSGWRSSSLNNLTKASGGLVLPFS